MKKKWTQAACTLFTAILLCSFVLPALADADPTLSTFAKYAKVLQGKGSSFKYDPPEVFEGKTVIAVYYDLNSDPVALSTKSLQDEGDFWLIPNELLAGSIKDADWALLVYVSDEDEYSESPLTVSCFAVDINKGTYYAPYDIYSRDTYIGNDERTYELSGTLSGIDEFILCQIWQTLHGDEDQKDAEEQADGANGTQEESSIDSSYQQALEYLKEEKYYSAYEAFNESYADDAYEQAQKCIKPWPKNGEVWRTSQGKGDPFELTVKVNQSDDRAMLLRFYRKGFPISYVFIGGTGSVKVTLPKGVYTIKDGVGSDWFGIKESFGRYGSYETMTFDNGSEEIKLQGGYGYTLTINASESNPNADSVGSEYESWEGFSK